MLRADKRPQWNTKKVPINGPRVTHYWDGNQVIGKQYGQSFDKPGGVAWDIFFLYDEGAEMDSLFQPWVSTGRTIIGARDKLKTDFDRVLKSSRKLLFAFVLFFLFKHPKQPFKPFRFLV